MIRVHASTHAVAGTASRPVPPPACLECGEPVLGRRDEAEFCGSACRTAWNNRRRQRGAELYDLYMVARHDRPLAAALRLWRFLPRLAARWRAEDRAARAGRRSWQDPHRLLERRADLHAVVVGQEGRQ